MTGKKIEVIKMVKSPYEYYGCRSSYTCQNCGIEHIMDSSKAVKGETPPEGKRYISGPCSCGHRCECLPEIRYEYIDAPSGDFLGARMYQPNLDLIYQGLGINTPEYYI